MIAYILDQNLDTLALIDTFESFIWTDRYNEAGDFELNIPASSPVMQYVQLDNYVSIKESEHLMVIESIELQTDVERGDFYVVSGRSLESILERRIITPLEDFANQSYMTHQVITLLVDENAAASASSIRRFPNFKVYYQNDDFDTSVYEGYFYGENLYEVVCALCLVSGLGFKIVQNYETKELLFSLYLGVNRSYDQDVVPYVVFSPSYGNILTSKQLTSKKAYKTFCYIEGEKDENGDTLKTTIGNGATPTPRGLERREMFIDGSSVSRTNYNTDDKLTDAQYRKRLQEEGKKALADCQIDEAFEAEIEATQQFIYGRDFLVGDIVQVANGYGVEKAYQITEIMRVHDTSGESLVPTFVAY